MPTPLSRKKRATQFENELADDLGARRTFLSGAGAVKSDVRRDARFTMVDGKPVRESTLTFRAEAKTTDKTRFAFTAKDWFDLTRAADAAGELPVFAIRYLPTHDTHVVVRWGLAEELGIEPRNDLAPSISKSITLLANLQDGCARVFPSKTSKDQRSDLVVIQQYHRFLGALYGHRDFKAATASARY